MATAGKLIWRKLRRYRYIYKYKTGLTKVKTRLAIAITTLELGTGGIVGAVAIFGSAHANSNLWQAQAPTGINFVCGGGNYPHTLQTVSEDNSGTLTGSGFYNPDNSYTWSLTGNVSGDTVNMSILYTGASAGSVYNLTGTIASDGSVSGTVDSNCQTFTMPTGSFLHYTNIIVTPTNTQGWSTADTRPGGAVNFVVDPTAPGDPHTGALQLTTDSTTAAKAQYLHAASESIVNVSSLSYQTKQNSANFAQGDPSYQLLVNLTGTGGFTTFVFEPYENTNQGTVATGNWQSWDVDGGQFWSSRTVTCSGGTFNAGAGGPPFYTLSQIKSECPEAVVVGYGVNVGTFNPSYDVETDLVNFNGTIYNFEPYMVATDKDACKNGGWANLADNKGTSFKNQGDCVSFVATGGKNLAAGPKQH